MSDGVASAQRTVAEERAFYDQMWSRYGHLDASSPAAFHRRRIIVDLVAKVAGPSPRVLRILDVGCGQGELIRDLAARLPGAEISGSDLSEQGLINSRLCNPGYDLFPLDIADANFAQANTPKLRRYDVAICSEVLEHIPNDGLAASNLAALLTPGGTLVVTVPGGKMSRFDKAIGHQRHYSAERLTALLRQAGLGVEKVMAWGFPFQNIYRTAVRVASRFSMPDGPQANVVGEGEGGGGKGGKGGLVASALSSAYVVFGRILKPLFYLNVGRGGEQMIAVARATQ
jgi:2-polyprenyl-3-methyl-5-hydroxy-6-metoxy-1,4-benzoquinol methylase